jgi:hypothetical protein
MRRPSSPTGYVRKEHGPFYRKLSENQTAALNAR